MSHVVEIATKIKDLVALKAACAELGFSFMENQREYRWYGTWVGDSPMPQGMTTADLGKCEHAIRVPDVNYEVGVRRQTDGSFALVYDWWNSGGLKQHLGTNAGPLVQAYAKHKTMREVARMGHRVVSQQVLEDGSVKLVVQQGGAW